MGARGAAFEINLEAAQIARRAADEYATPSRPRFVAGSIGPKRHAAVGRRPGALRRRLRASCPRPSRCRRGGLVEGGADLLIIETQQDVLETRAADRRRPRGVRRRGRAPVPLQVQVALDVTGRMLLGTDIPAVLTILQADAGGRDRRSTARSAPSTCASRCATCASARRVPVSVIPNAGLPQNVDGVATIRWGRRHGRGLAEFVAEFGTRSWAAAAARPAPHCRAREARGGPAPPAAPGRLRAGAGQRHHRSTLDQQPKPLLIGERVNTQGSRAFKELMLRDDYDGVAPDRARPGGGRRARARRLRRADRARRRAGR